MPKPASRSRKPKPVAIFCRAQIDERVVDEKPAEQADAPSDQDLEDDAADLRIVAENGAAPGGSSPAASPAVTRACERGPWRDGTNRNGGPIAARIASAAQRIGSA